MVQLDFIVLVVFAPMIFFIGFAFTRSFLFPVAREEGEKEMSGVYPNLFAAYPPFQLDANFGFTAGVAEMLLHSHAGEIHLLPGLPAVWQNGHIHGLKARGNLTIDIVWENHALQQVLIQPAKTGYYKIRYTDRVANLLLEKGKRYQMDSRLAILISGSKIPLEY
jgi:hypothetical protein